EPDQAVGNAIGEAPLFPHLDVEPRGEGAAAEDVIDDIGRHEVGIAARKSRAAEMHYRLRHIEVDDDAAAEPLRDDRATGVSSALAGSAPKVRSMSAPAVSASMSPTTAILTLPRVSARRV